MKYTTPTLLAILASASFASAAPTAVNFESQTTTLVKKDEVANALSILDEIASLNQKRDLIEDEGELHELSKRADNLLGQLLSALSSSGIIGDVWNILTTDQQLKSVLGDLIKSAVQGAITHGPALIKAVWQSGLLQKVFSDIWNSPELKSALFNVAKAIFSSGLNLLKAFLANRNNNNNGQQKREAEAAAIEEFNFNPDMYYDKRDLLDVAQTVVTAIKNTGIVQNLVKKALADPQASISFLTNALKNGVVVAKDIYNWSKDNGLLQSGLDFIKKNGPTFAKDIANFLGGKIANGEASVKDIDDADAGTSSGTSTASTKKSKRDFGPTTLVQKRLY
ncbi:hypothetical protein ACI3LY_001398 [Candidozyma auris]|uniref:Opaque-phase-specific protein OP4 n=2 Tax=Candidozyma auris TaxID=498019 RepID=A0AB73RYS7_CANAR|nr:hypothetical protein QG37_04113 [[Candida] auris]PIS50333.1 hypothetical protein B9J08_004148 [[Candida] auris]PSK77704.1 hypothetical protein CJJ07_002443 [[Candida] auris]QWW25392.1 hypothetical protein CA7LBN_004279 [[Candida] auris]